MKALNTRTKELIKKKPQDTTSIDTIIKKRLKLATDLVLQRHGCPSGTGVASNQDRSLSNKEASNV